MRTDLSYHKSGISRWWFFISFKDAPTSYAYLSAGKPTKRQIRKFKKESVLKFKASV